MAAKPPIELIYCADGNKRFAQIAIETGYLYGAQVPNTVYFPPYFCDQNWKNPDFERYMTALSKHKPQLASVIDWEDHVSRAEVLRWAESAAEFVETVIIVPKVAGGIATLPRVIGGKEVRLGYSVLTSFGGTIVSLTEFLGWPVHLLGGSPSKQFALAGLSGGKRLVDAPRLNVVSVDGNYHQLMARHNRFFIFDGSARYAKNRFWPTLREADGKRWGDGSSKADAP